MPAPVAAQSAMLEDTIPAGANFDKAQFRLWLPPGDRPVRAVVVLVPGSNGDGRATVSDSAWQAFATRHQLALVGCRITDKPHDQGFVEEYADVSHGSGQALLDALTNLGRKARHDELGRVPLLLWGMSAGGEFDYEFTAWHPDRVAAFVVNKGGIYFTALTSQAARQVPGMLFIGGKDLEQRINTITGLFDLNRRGGALWALANEPGAAHVIGRSRDLSIIFFDDVLPLRLGANDALMPLAESSGQIGDLHTFAFHPMAAGPAPANPTAWLPTERVARAWAAMMTDQPFDTKEKP
ncbi:MAG TPA: hypothetical protein VHW65_10435 [Gemmatimonadales bacterium]|nr:hypothetical protein [Gemmatimonadales bacterium]